MCVCNYFRIYVNKYVIIINVVSVITIITNMCQHMQYKCCLLISKNDFIKITILFTNFFTCETDTSINAFKSVSQARNVHHKLCANWLLA